MEKGEQGGDRAIHARHGNRMQAMTEKELRRADGREFRRVRGLRWKDHDARINQTTENHTIVRIIDKIVGVGKKKGQKKQNKEETTSSSESDACKTMFMSLT